MPEHCQRPDSRAGSPFLWECTYRKLPKQERGGIKRSMPAKRKVSPGRVALRIEIPLALFEKISDFRFEQRLETRGHAIRALLTAGLNALAKPAQPPQPHKLVPYAGQDVREKSILG